MELKISEKNLIRAYKKADQNGKELLSNLFGNQLKLSDDIMDRVKTFEDVCIEANVDPQEYECPVDASKLEKYIANFRKLLLIVEVLNEGWKPDPNNKNKGEYWPRFKYSADSVFYFYDCDYTYSLTSYPFSFKNRGLAEYAGRRFPEIYNQFLQP